MSTESITTDEDQAKVDWLRVAVQESIDSLDRGEGTSFSSMDELASYIRELGKQAATEEIKP